MIATFFLNFTLSVLGTAWIIWHARTHVYRYGSDMPQRFHKGHVPRLGGVSMLASMLACCLILVAFGHYLNIPAHYREVFLPLLLLSPAILCGILEDLTQRIPVRIRLTVTLLCAFAVCYVVNLHIVRLDLPLLDAGLMKFPVLGMGLAILAIGGLPHAFNIIDGYNGLAGMVAILISLALVHVALQVGDRQLAVILMALIGATAGFLVWNYPHGKIFAGDGGAYMWGLVLAYGCVALVSRNPEVSPWFPMLLLCYPVSETLFSIYRKKVRGQSPGMADALHLHQLIYRRIVRVVLDSENETEEMLQRNNKTSPYLWGVTLLTVLPAVLFWRTSWVLMLCCFLFACLYIGFYISIVRFKFKIRRE